ncbi:MAG: gliding motility-associated protein GldE [Cytophagales bacterium]|nr:gliding motility-associated protein GldE [Cytophagales bacterium]
MELAVDDPLPEQFFFSAIIQSDWIFYSANSLVFLLLLSLSFLVSGSEVAFFSLTSDQIDQCRQSEIAKDRQVCQLLSHPKKLLATILIFNNFVNIAIISLSTIITWKLTGTKNPQGIFVATLSGIVTFAILFFGEVIPKNYALKNSMGFARLMGHPLAFASSIFSPLSWVLMSLSNVIEKRVEKKGYEVSIDELNYALDITSKDSTQEEQEILKGIVNFGTLTVKQVMRSRHDITAFESDMDFGQLLKEVSKCNYSRIPIYSETIDRIDGILYAKDLLPHISDKEDYDWKSLLRKGYYVPESKKIDSLLKEFQNKRVHLAIVVDEYGGTAGLITLEDIIEEIVGEINDEFDVPEDVGYNQIDEHTYVFEAKISINDFCKVLGRDISDFEQVKGESESLGGLLLELNHNMPSTGMQIFYKDMVFTVVVADKKRIKKVRVQVKP